MGLDGATINLGFHSFRVTHSGPWLSLLKLSLCRAAADPWAAKVVWAGLGAAGWTMRSFSRAEGDGDAEADPFLCDGCGVWFDSVIAVKMTRLRAHGLAGPAAVARLPCISSVCSICGIDFVVRVRALRRLAQRRRCQRPTNGTG